MIEESLFRMSSVSNQERISRAVVALDDKQDLYFQVLRVIKHGQSEYIKRNPATGEFEFSLNLKLQNQSTKLARLICETRNVVEYISAFLDQFVESKMEFESNSSGGSKRDSGTTQVDFYGINQTFSLRKHRKASQTQEIFIERIQELLS